MNLNGKQIILIVVAILSALAGATTQLTDLFGPTVTKSLVSAANLVTTILSSLMVALNSQSSQVKDVLAMPGVERINVNENANKTLATIAMDSTLNNIAPTPQAMDVVNQTAKGA